MGTWSQEFLDVTTNEGGLGAVAGSANAGGDNLKRVQRKLTELGRRVQAAGAAGQSGLLYFPPGRYRIGLPPRNTDEERLAFRTTAFLASLVIPANVELYMSPGAVLVPDRGCVIDIQGALTCDESQVFDLSEDGLVVFGQGIESVRPEWWGAGSVARDWFAVQAAIDAAIHNRRSYGFAAGGTTPVLQVRPALPVELRGNYQIARPLVIDGGQWSEVLDRLHPGLRGTRPPTPDGGRPVVRGVWSGHSRQGASLVATSFQAGASATALLRLDRVAGATIEGVGFDATATMGLGCVKIDVEPTRFLTHPTGARHDNTFRQCRFQGSGRGAAAAMVEADAPLGVSRIAELRSPDSVISAGMAFSFPVRQRSRAGADLSGLTFFDCDFEPSQGASAVLLRSNQTLPMVLRSSRFVGDSLAMVDLWGGTTLADDCLFANRRSPAADPQPVTLDLIRRVGFEEPEGTDFHLRFEHVIDRRFEPTRPIAPDRTVGDAEFPLDDTLPAITAFRCTSRSRRVLSTAIPYPWLLQWPGWPSFLVDHRHLVGDPPAQPIAAVLWGMHSKIVPSLSGPGPRQEQRMDFAAPLVLLNGQYSGILRIYNAALQCAVVGSRDRAGGGFTVRVDPRVMGLTWNTAVYGLRVDQALNV